MGEDAKQLPERAWVRPADVGDMFGDPDAHQHWLRVATMFAKSTVIPAHLRDRVGDVLIGLDLARRLNMQPLMVIQNLYVVQGNPGWKSQFLVALAQSAGWGVDWEAVSLGDPIDYRRKVKDGFVPGRMDNLKVQCTLSRPGVEKKSTWITSTRAISAGWANNEQYTHSAELMLRWRTAAEAVRFHCPGILMGLQTEWELRDREVIDAEDAQPSATYSSATRGLGAVDAKLRGLPPGIVGQYGNRLPPMESRGNELDLGTRPDPSLAGWGLRDTGAGASPQWLEARVYVPEDGGPVPCPQCHRPMEAVLYPGGLLNRDQWESVRAGDWWCAHCPSDGRSELGGAYFFGRVTPTGTILTPAAHPPNRTEEPTPVLPVVDPSPEGGAASAEGARSGDGSTPGNAPAEAEALNAVFAERLNDDDVIPTEDAKRALREHLGFTKISKERYSAAIRAGVAAGYWRVTDIGLRKANQTTAGARELPDPAGMTLAQVTIEIADLRKLHGERIYGRVLMDAGRTTVDGISLDDGRKLIVALRGAT